MNRPVYEPVNGKYNPDVTRWQTRSAENHDKVDGARVWCPRVSDTNETGKYGDGDNLQNKFMKLTCIILFEMTIPNQIEKKKQTMLWCTVKSVWNEAGRDNTCMKLGSRFSSFAQKMAPTV